MLRVTSCYNLKTLNFSIDMVKLKKMSENDTKGRSASALYHTLKDVGV